MTIAWYPLEPDEPPRRPPPPPVVKEDVPSTVESIFKNETTECNYLVLLFVAGVLLLAFTDAMKN
jgi:hypothetical protein